MKRAPSLAALGATLLAASFAQATPRATASQLHEEPGLPGTPPVRRPFDVTVSQAKAQIAKIVAWDVTMQATDCTDPDAGVDAAMNLCERGGIIEVASGPGHLIVESDNTQQAVGLWSESQTLGGLSYAPNVSLAFQYLATHPGYLEWRDGPDKGPDYYSVYNCGWGVRAVILYEAATGDLSHHAYGAMCASHIATNAPMLVTGTAQLIDVGPAGWAASGLWAWGEANGDAASKTAAANLGGLVKAWIEGFPAHLSSTEWAMTGAAPFYGVVASYMKEHPTELVPWVTTYAPDLGGWIDESTVATPDDWTDWRNALNAWNMLAHFSAASALGPAAGKADAAIAKDILSKLVAQADATTGAIPGSQQRPSTEAESWITAYMVYFGLLEVIDAPAADAGTGTDAGKDAGADATAPKDAGSPLRDASGPPPRDATADAPSPGGPSGGGCSCALAVPATGRALPLAGLLAGLLLARRRRGRARPSR